jgi:hypothetical protein
MRQKSIEKPDVNYTLDQMNLTDIYKAFHSTAVEYSLHMCSVNILQSRSRVGPQKKATSEENYLS